MTAPDPIRLDAPFLHAPAARRVADALAAGGVRVWFVGGCVRNALLGDGPSDLDMTTDARPETVTALLRKAGMRVAPTGIEHGTVTAVHKGEPVEITTLRADVATDGRRATVAFTEDLAEDAARRDFTMNALYAAPDGTVIDPLGGLPDLRARRVRFIGDPNRRIAEDYLRILRFFRFIARHGDPAQGVDPEGLAACAAGLEGLDGLSRERVGAEMRKLLGTPDPSLALAAMQACGALGRVARGAEAAAIPPLVHVESLHGAAPSWPRRAAAMLAGACAMEGRALDAALGEAWRLSRAETRGLAAISAALADPVPPARAAYLHGAEAARAAALIAAAGGAPPPPGLEAEIARGAAAVFPVQAKTLLARGCAPGPALGAALARMKRRWIASDFTLDAAALIEGDAED